MPTEVDVQARVIAGDEERPAGEEKEAEGARAAPARQKSAASAEWARRLEAEGDLQDRSVARSTAFAIGQRYFRFRGHECQRVDLSAPPSVSRPRSSTASSSSIVRELSQLDQHARYVVSIDESSTFAIVLFERFAQYVLARCAISHARATVATARAAVLAAVAALTSAVAALTSAVASAHATSTAASDVLERGRTRGLPRLCAALLGRHGVMLG